MSGGLTTLAGAQAAVELYFRMMRGTGRTDDVLAGVKNGDVVVCLTGKERARIEARCKDRGLKQVTVTVWGRCRRDNEFLIRRIRSEPAGRVVFDHSVVESIVTDQLRELEGYFTYLAETAQAEVMDSGPNDPSRQIWQRAFS